LNTDVYAGAVKEPRWIQRVPWRGILLTMGLLLVLVLFIAVYYKATFVGLVDRHAVDVAQIARNLATGHGFTTRFVRPFNVGLVANPDLQTAELNTAPAFPYAVAALYQLRTASDQGIIWVSLLFLMLTIVSTYLLGWFLFDRRTGLLATAVLGMSAPILNAGASGTEWTMAAFLFVLMLFSVALHHRTTLGKGRVHGLVYVVLSALLLALLYLTNHVLVFLAVPLALYYAITGPKPRLQTIVFVASAIAFIAPWAYRNASLTGGSILGANAWDIFVRSTLFPGDVFFRSADPLYRSVARVIFFPIEHFGSFVTKLITGSSDIALSTVPMLGLAILPLAVVSMLYKFKSESANAVRLFTYGAIVLCVVCFAIFSVDTRAIILFGPIVGIFGSAYFFLLLDAKGLHPVYARTAIAVVLLASCWPSLAAIVERNNALPRSEVLGTNDYFVSLNAGGIRGQVYTDVPWLAAWRMDVTAIWLPHGDDDVVELTSAGFPLRVVIMTPEVATYPPGEMWYLAYTSKLWRDYVRDPKECMAEFRRVARLPESWNARFERYMRERTRTLALSRSLGGFSVRDSGMVRGVPGKGWGATPDNILVLTGVGQ
jgi:hypothetical protein